MPLGAWLSRLAPFSCVWRPFCRPTLRFRAVSPYLILLTVLIAILLGRAGYARSNQIGNLSYPALATYILNYGSKPQSHKSLKIPWVFSPLPSEGITTKRGIPSLPTRDRQNAQGCVVISLAAPYRDTEQDVVIDGALPWNR